MFATAKARQRGAAADDDDNISLTSTQESDYSEDHEYAVDSILAEKTEDGSPRYLLQWTGYPIERSTWEPVDSIVDVSMLQTWKVRQSQEVNGLEEPFDVNTFEATVRRLEEEKEARISQRRARRARLDFVSRDADARHEGSDEEKSAQDTAEQGSDHQKKLSHHYQIEQKTDMQSPIMAQSASKQLPAHPSTVSIL